MTLQRDPQNTSTQIGQKKMQKKNIMKNSILGGPNDVCQLPLRAYEEIFRFRTGWCHPHRIEFFGKSLPDSLLFDAGI